ncbi:MAG: tRNA(Met) cytidine acetyltransferase TmcA [Thermoprotei archaeon]
MIMEILKKISNEALLSNERRLVAVSSIRSLETLIEFGKRYIEEIRKTPLDILVAEHDEDSKLKEMSKNLHGNVMHISFKETENVMGGTWDLLIADLSRQLNPNDIGRLVETVRGKGLILFAIPPIKNWLNSLTEFQRSLITYPYKDRDIRHLFKQRFLQSITTHDGTWLIDEERNEYFGKPRMITHTQNTLKLSGSGPLSLALTQDQSNVITTVSELIKSNETQTLIIIANRGRGKSAAIGLGIALIAEYAEKTNERVKIVVTAPQYTGVKTLIEFIVKGLNSLGMRYWVKQNKEGITMIKTRRMKVFYVRPTVVPSLKADIKIVDEAASIPVTLLLKIVNSSKRTIFSTTVHGYEGSGRGFSIRFLKYLKQFKGINVKEMYMVTPIRYPEGDPVEQWLYDTLLLNSEPVQLTDEEKNLPPTSCTYKVLDFTNIDENTLRHFYGIYVLAHYRNRPEDLATLLDAPHHSARALMLNSNPVVSIQLSEEGGFDDTLTDLIYNGMDIHGHIIPCRTLWYYGFKEFGKMKGWRIVRIATHPDLMNKGFGSRALEELIKEAINKGYDWLGSGFGATEELLNFWFKNGFHPIHLSPTPNPTSGEYSVLVVKPISEKALRIITKVNTDFRLRIIEMLHDIYFELNPRLAYMLISQGLESAKITLSKPQTIRLKGFIEGRLTYEVSADAIRAFLKLFLLDKSPDKPSLDINDGALLIAKILQGKSWKRIENETKIDKPKDHIRTLIRKLVSHYEI